MLRFILFGGGCLVFPRHFRISVDGKTAFVVIKAVLYWDNQAALS